MWACQVWTLVLLYDTVGRKWKHETWHIDRTVTIPHSTYYSNDGPNGPYKNVIDLVPV